MRRLCVLLTHYFSGDEIEKNDVGGECSTYGVEQRCILGLVGKIEGKRPLGRPRLDGRIILRWVFKKWNVRAWTGSMWLRIGTDGRHLRMR